MRFRGRASSRFDGENCEGEGVLTLDDGTEHSLSFGSTPHGASYELDGSELGPGELHEALDAFFSEHWPDGDEDWDEEIDLQSA